MLHSFICVVYTIQSPNVAPVVHKRFFTTQAQADFYYRAKLEHIKDTMKFALQTVSTPGAPWKLYQDTDNYYWHLTNSYIKVSHTLQLIEDSFDTDGPTYDRVDELLCNMVDYFYAIFKDKYSISKINEMLVEEIGMDDYELLKYGVYDSADPRFNPEEPTPPAETPVPALAPPAEVPATTTPAPVAS